MPNVTNKLVGQLKSSATRMVLPAVGAVAAVLAFGFASNHPGVHAASASPSATYSAAPMNENSVSALTALDRAVEDVAARVTPAVVNIAVTARGKAGEEADGNAGSQEQQQQLPPGFAQFFGPGGPFGQQGGHGMQQAPQQELQHGIGSGIIISPDGYILTNNHVIDGAVQIKVTLHDRRVLTGKLIGADKLTDLAVVKVDAHNLPSIAWGGSGKLEPGQTVLAFGSPFGYLQFSVTRGIVSAVNRADPFAKDARRPGGFIQTDAAINPGNSGGPLVNAHGELVGINTAIISDSGSFAGAGFAIPSQMARVISTELIKSGVVHHGYLGISMNDVTPENAEFFKLQDADGAIVTQVTPDSPAGVAGIKSGDVLRELNGQKIANGSALQVAVSQDAPGTTITLGVMRDGQARTVNVKVGEYNVKEQVAGNEGPGAAKGGRLGLGIGDLTADMRQQMGIPDQVQGAAVGSVRPASPADDAGIAPGDVIVEMNRKPVTSAEQFNSAVHGSPAGKDILLLVWSRGGASYRVVHPESAG